MSILTVNAGSSTLKLSVFDDAAEICLATVAIDRAPDAHAFDEALRSLKGKMAEAVEDVRGVGHRVVHGGTELREATVVNHHVRSTIEHIADLAPLHNAPALAALDAATHRFPDVAHVAAFDTAFFADLPDRAAIYPVPWEWRGA